jgi:hypothetical protein
MKTILGIIVGLLLMTSCGARIPQNKARAQKVIEKKARQINAISDFHDLGSPFMIRDTVKFTVPSFSGRVTSRNDLLDKVNTSFDRIIFVDGTLVNDDLVEAKKEVVRVIEEFSINESYEDSLVSINITGSPDSIVFSYNIKERNLSKPIEIEGIKIDTVQKWYEDKTIKFLAILIVVAIIVVVIKQRSPN